MDGILLNMDNSLIGSNDHYIFLASEAELFDAFVNVIQRFFNFAFLSATYRRVFLLSLWYIFSGIFQVNLVVNSWTSLGIDEIKNQYFIDIQIYSYDPDIVVGYSSQRYSWGYLIERSLVIGRNLLSEISRVPVGKCLFFLYHLRNILKLQRGMI